LDLSTNPVGAAVVIPPLNLNTNTVTFECLIKPTYDQTLNYNTIFAGVVVHRNVLANNTACGLDFASATTLGYEWNTKNAAEPIPAFDSGLTPIEGSWNYVALTISPTTATVYLYDGTNWSVSVDSGHTNFAAQAFNGPTCIGFDPLQRTNFFNGSVDEVAIYNKTLTEGAERDAGEFQDFRAALRPSRSEGTLSAGLWNNECYLKMKGEADYEPAANHAAAKGVPQSLPRAPQDRHILEWIEACKGRGKTFSPFEFGGHVTEIGAAGLVALRLGRDIEWNGRAMKAKEEPDAAPLVQPQSRKGWAA
jgi:hypothetical protein